MQDPTPNPFREGRPDFGDPRLNEARDDVAAGNETTRALMQLESFKELVAGINALDGRDAKRALLATLVERRLRLGRPL